MLQTVFHTLAFLATVGSISGFLWWLARTVKWLTKKVKMEIEERQELSEKVNALWDFQMARGYAEAVIRGQAIEENIFTGQRLPPLDERRLVVSQSMKARYEMKREGKELTVAQELRQAYRSLHLTRIQLEMWISREFREWIVDNICIPLQVHEGACIAIAMAIAKEE